MAAHDSNTVRSIDLVYARALLELAQEAGQLDDVAAQMAQLAGLIDSEPDLARLLAARTLTRQQRTGVIDSVFKGRVHELIYRLLLVINAKDRLDLVPGIIRAFAQAWDESRGIVEVDAYVAARLDDAQVDSVRTALGELTGRKVVISQSIDPSLIGGLKLRIGDQLIDGSVAAQLRIMRKRLVEDGRDQVRTDVQRFVVE